MSRKLAQVGSRWQVLGGVGHSLGIGGPLEAKAATPPYGGKNRGGTSINFFKKRGVEDE